MSGNIPEPFFHQSEYFETGFREANKSPMQTGAGESSNSDMSMFLDDKYIDYTQCQESDNVDAVLNDDERQDPDVVRSPLAVNTLVAALRDVEAGRNYNHRDAEFTSETLPQTAESLFPDLHDGPSSFDPRDFSYPGDSASHSDGSFIENISDYAALNLADLHALAFGFSPSGYHTPNPIPQFYYQEQASDVQIIGPTELSNNTHAEANPQYTTISLLGDRSQTITSGVPLILTTFVNPNPSNPSIVTSGRPRASSASSSLGPIPLLEPPPVRTRGHSFSNSSTVVKPPQALQTNEVGKSETSFIDSTSDVHHGSEAGLKRTQSARGRPTLRSSRSSSRMPSPYSTRTPNRTRSNSDLSSFDSASVVSSTSFSSTTDGDRPLDGVVKINVSTPAIRDAISTRRRREAKFLCEICDDLLTTAQRLERHINAHRGIKPFACPHCERAFTQQSDRSRHVHDIHICRKCLEVPPHIYTQRGELRQHYQLEHHHYP